MTSAAPGWATLVLLATLLAGCGEDAAPAEAAPALADRLALVDQAVVSGDASRIRQRVAALIVAAESARASGTIDQAEADRIVAAAEALLARLPDEQPSPQPSASAPSETPPAPREGEEGEEDAEVDDDDQAREEAEKRKEELAKKREEEAKKRAEEAKKRAEEAQKQEKEEEKDDD